MEYKLEWVRSGCTRVHYKLNGVNISITPEMVQDLNGPMGPTVEKHIIKLYK